MSYNKVSYKIKTMPILTQEQKDNAVKLYNQGLSTYKVAKQIGCHQGTIHNLVKKLGINRDLATANRTNNFDEYFFHNIDNEYKAYWLGFIYADGCILQNKKWRQNRLQIGLSIADIDHLYKFKEHISYTGNVNTYSKMCPKAGMKDYCRIAINNKTLIKGLIKHGATPEKTHTITFPNIDAKLHKHFIRGYFDGDGMITTRNDRAYVFSITSTFNFLERLTNILKAECNIKLLNITKDRSMFRIVKSAKKDVISIMNWLYKDSNVYLERKYAKYLSGPSKRA